MINSSIQTAVCSNADPPNLEIREEKNRGTSFIKISQPRVFNSEVHTPRRLCGVNYNVKRRGTPLPP